MKANTKLALSAIIWIPVFFLGALCGLVWGPFRAGLGIAELFDIWFEQAEEEDKVKP